MKRFTLIAVTATALPALIACELAPKASYQNGYRGTGMDTVKVSAKAAAEEVPAPPYTPPGTDGPRAGSIYQNVKVLGDVSDEQFNYTMAAITQWVSPGEGCNYCHNPADMASDEKYTKVVARQMLQMNRDINRNWIDHVGQTGVTCYTCHRGQNIPSEKWALPSDDPTTIARNKRGQNTPESNSSYSSLPTAAVALYLMGGVTPDTDVRVVSKTAHPSPANRLKTMDAEHNYALMMHISQALGVNCTYCHNAQSFQTWASSNPPRQTAFYGVRMVREINGKHITPLAPVFPANRKGEAGDPYKVNCATCHRGQNKPLGGAKMAQDYPALWMQTVAAPATPAPVQASAPAAN